jgi:hypothetical protein
MRVANPVRETRPVPAVQRAEQQPPGQPAAGSAASGGDPERELARTAGASRACRCVAGWARGR